MLEAWMLAKFEPGLTWDEIMCINGFGMRWWREAVVAAECNGWLRWRTKRGRAGRWQLTEEGKAWIATQGKGSA